MNGEIELTKLTSNIRDKASKIIDVTWEGTIRFIFSLNGATIRYFVSHFFKNHISAQLVKFY